MGRFPKLFYKNSVGRAVPGSYAHALFVIFNSNEDGRLRGAFAAHNLHVARQGPQNHRGCPTRSRAQVKPLIGIANDILERVLTAGIDGLKT